MFKLNCVISSASKTMGLSSIVQLFVITFLSISYTISIRFYIKDEVITQKNEIATQKKVLKYFDFSLEEAKSKGISEMNKFFEIFEQ